MAKMNSKARRIVDAESKIVLRPEASVALVVAGTVAETGKTLNALTSYWDSGVIPMDALEVVFHVNAALFTSNETYALSVEVADDLGFTTNVVVVANLPNVASKLGMYVVHLDIPTIVKLSPAAKFIRVKSIAAGTAPNLDYFSWMI